ncbi:hypothetical protein BH20VER1_BH20VER1_30970 [soil metagenome]
MQNRRSRPALLVYLPVLVAVLLSGSGCHRKSGEAVVLRKEHIPAAESATSPSDALTEPSPARLEPSPGLAPASSDSRAVAHGQWLVHVEMVNDRRRLDVRVEQPLWEKLKEGDRVDVTYREGKYTGTVWASEIK